MKMEKPVISSTFNCQERLLRITHLSGVDHVNQRPGHQQAMNDECLVSDSIV